ncbi:MAG: hypothetical protein QXE01_00285 [Sulfolobales archaeon]
MGLVRDNIYPIISGIIVGAAGGALGLNWLWISILIAIPQALLSPSKTWLGVINNLVASSAIFITPIIASITTDPKAINMLDTFASIAGISWITLIAISITAYIATSLLTYIATTYIKKIILEIYAREKS